MLHTVPTNQAEQERPTGGPETSHVVPPPVQWLPSGAVRLVDQTRLPHHLEFLDCRTISELAEAILKLQVRGAPAIGLAGAYGLALAAHLSGATDPTILLQDLEQAARVLRQTRPTAVNLPWALDTVMEAAREARQGGAEAIRQAVYAEAQRLDQENEAANLRMGEYGAELLKDGMNVLTHCNAGPLAAGGIGTALGVIYTAHKQGKRLHVWVDETRPLLQGARLTAWELGQWGIPYTLIADSMAASLMKAGRVDAVITGADRIAANGDVANKIGTYGLAVLANAHGLPYYAAAPSSTIDPHMSGGADIVIEERHADEVTHHGGRLVAPQQATVYNPAFDVSPASLVSCIITESGLIRPPFEEGLRQSAALSWRLRHGPDSVAQAVQAEGVLSSTRGESR
ncbi:MAG: S-methyl-5-thioribose-1-phosphate isomerase [Chloroflexota bacterium]|nr:S-methyl-5-thioribose-1-phosphate isomerase [Chloroflexota bacterium]